VPPREKSELLGQIRPQEFPLKQASTEKMNPSRSFPASQLEPCKVLPDSVYIGYTRSSLLHLLDEELVAKGMAIRVVQLEDSRVSLFHDRNGPVG